MVCLSDEAIRVSRAHSARGSGDASIADELKLNYAQCKEYQVLERVFGEHYRLEKSVVVPKAQKELGANSLQSPDDWEATIREFGSGLKQGYVANLSETCDPEIHFN